MDLVAPSAVTEDGDDGGELRAVRDAVRQAYPRIGPFNLHLYQTASEMVVDPHSRTITKIFGPTTPVIEVWGAAPAHEFPYKDGLDFKPGEMAVWVCIETETYEALYVTSPIPGELLAELPA